MWRVQRRNVQTGARLRNPRHRDAELSRAVVGRGVITKTSDIKHAGRYQQMKWRIEWNQVM